MRGLSSIMRRRWMSRLASLAMAALRSGERQRQREGRALADAGAARKERTSELTRGEGTAVQAKAMAVGTRGEAVVEDTLEILRWDADAAVDDRDRDAFRGRADAHRHAFLAAWQLGAGVLGVTDHVHEDLQHLVLVDLNERHFGELAHDRHTVTAE